MNERWLIYLSAVPWDGPRQRQHELARQMAGRFCVLWVDPLSRTGSRSPAPAEVVPGLWAVRPWGDARFARPLPFVNRALRALEGRGLSRWVAARGDAALVWIDEALAAPCAASFTGVPLVYDVTDLDWTFARRWNRPQLRRAMRRAARSAAVTVVSSESLAREVAADAGRTLVVPNACDPSHFRPEVQAAPELAALERPVLGFIGYAGARSLDLELLEQLARIRPDCSLVFVGGAQDRVRERLGALANVTFLGEQPYARLPEFVRGFDVALIPYRVGALVDYVFPKKLFEYLAAGRPVVATPLPELRPYDGLVQLADTPERFAAAVAAALAEPAERARESAADRRAIAAQHTWDGAGELLHRELAALVGARG